MPRPTPADRLQRLIEVAAAAFVRDGFHRTQMDVVAADLSVSKGTVYRSVESKEALFAAVLDFGDTPDQLPVGGRLISRTVADVSERLRDRLTSSIAALELVEAAERAQSAAGPDACGNDVERIARDVFEMMAAHRVRIMVLDRCAKEIPELAGDWYDAGRYALVDLWAAYLARLAGSADSSAEHDVMARTIVELITFWAVKIPWDPAPRTYPPDLATPCAAMVHTLVTGAVQ